MYASIFGLVIFMGAMVAQRPRAIGRLLFQSGFVAVSVLLVISTIQATHLGEAALQLTHFLPYFVLWAALVVYLNHTLGSVFQVARTLIHWAWILVIGAIPLNLLAWVEFWLKRLPGQPLGIVLANFPPLDWIYTGLVIDPRAFSLFHSPNTFANYIVMTLGLSIGLLAVTEQPALAANPIGSPSSFPSQPHRLHPGVARGLLCLSLIFSLVGLYCAGSRNGYIAAVVILLCGVFALRQIIWVRWLGLGTLAALAASIVVFGIGERTLSWRWVTQDPRVYVWRLAMRLIQERPWWGHGLGSYKFLYDGSVPDYDEIAHAHNLWLFLAADAGLIVTVVLTLVIGGLCYRGVRAMRQLGRSRLAQIALGYGLCFLGMGLIGLFDVPIHDARPHFLTWLSLAVLGSLPHWARGEGDNSS